MFELKLANGHYWVYDANDVAIKHQLDGGYSITGPYQSKLPTCGAVLWLYVSKPTWQITYVMAAGCGLILPMSTLGHTVSHTGTGKGRVITMTRSGMVTEYQFLQWVGMHLPHQKVEGLVLSVLVIT